MAYQEYLVPTGGITRQHKNGHALRPTRRDFCAIVQAEQERQRRIVHDLAARLIDIMGDAGYDAWIESVSGEYTHATLIPVLQAKLAELVAVESCPSHTSIAHTNEPQEISA